MEEAVAAIPTEQALVETHETTPEHAPRPKRVKQERDPNAMSLNDEASLSWYFGDGLSIYERSTFSAIVERIRLDGFGSAPCARCDGAGILDKGGFAMATRCTRCTGKGELGEPKRECPDCRGSGQLEPYEVRAEFGGWCDSCRGSGCTPVERRAQRRKSCTKCDGKRRAPAFNHRPGIHDIACDRCIGSGHEPLTAAPLPKATSEGGVVAKDSALERFAITSRRVASVEIISPDLSSALEDYYGDVGSRWGREDFGRIFALYAHTPAGKRLARWGSAEGTRKPKGKKSRRAAAKATEEARSGVRWKNPDPVPLRSPFELPIEQPGKFIGPRLLNGACHLLYPASTPKLERLGDFIGPRRLNGSCYARDPMLIGRQTRPEHEQSDDTAPPPLHVSVQEAIWSQVVTEKSQPKRERAVLIAAANKQAQELYARAVRAWNRTSTDTTDKVTQRLVKRLVDAGFPVAANELVARTGGMKRR